MTQRLGRAACFCYWKAEGKFTYKTYPNGGWGNLETPKNTLTLDACCVTFHDISMYLRNLWPFLICICWFFFYYLCKKRQALFAMLTCCVLVTTTRGVMHSLFLRGHELGGGGRHVTHSSHNSTYFYLFFETFPNALTLSWNILILTFIDYVSWSSGWWSK